MGVDTAITFTPGTRVRDVAEVLGILAGLPSHMERLNNRDEHYLAVAGASVKAIDSVPEAAYIWIEAEGNMIDGERFHHVMYHFEWSKDGAPPGSTGMMPRSTSFWIAAGLRLVEFFGGTIDFNDSDAIDVDASFEPSILPAEDGEPWQAYERAKAAVVPLTQADIEAAAKHAAYIADGRWR